MFRMCKHDTDLYKSVDSREAILYVWEVYKAQLKTAEDLFTMFLLVLLWGNKSLSTINCHGYNYNYSGLGCVSFPLSDCILCSSNWTECGVATHSSVTTIICPSIYPNISINVPACQQLLGNQEAQSVISPESSPVLWHIIPVQGTSFPAATFNLFSTLDIILCLYTRSPHAHTHTNVYIDTYICLHTLGCMHIVLSAWIIIWWSADGNQTELVWNWFEIVSWSGIVGKLFRSPTDVRLK